jgi:hypothetical protein
VRLRAVVFQVLTAMAVTVPAVLLLLLRVLLLLITALLLLRVLRVPTMPTVLLLRWCMPEGE